MTRTVLRTLLCSALLCAGTIHRAAAQSERTEKGNLIIEGVPATPEALRDRLNAYQNTRSAGFVDWDEATGGMMITTRFGNAPQLHHVAGPGMDRRQITFFPEPIGGASYCPDVSQRGFLFSKDVGGNEFRQTYWFDLNTGSYRLLTDGKSQNSLGGWNHKGTQFAYTSTRRNGKDYDIYLGNHKNSDHSLVLQVEGAWGPRDWSPDDSKMIVGQGISAAESYIYTLDLATKKLTKLNESAEKFSYGGAAFSADAKSVYLISNQGSEFEKLRKLDLATGKQNELTSGINWDVQGFTLNDARTQMAFAVNANGLTELYLMDLKSEKYEQVKGLPVGLIGGVSFNKAGTKLALNLSSATTNSDVFVYTLATKKLERWTNSEVGGLNTSTFVDARLITFPTFDQVDGKPRQISSFYFPAANKSAAKNGKVPVVINIHGGPEGQAVPSFSSIYQFMSVEMGVAVLTPNVRGSTGYGKTFLGLDNGMLRENSVKDIGALLDWIKTQPDLDPERVAVWGGSYGGYMTLACMTHYSDRLRCGVDVVGISNFITFLENTEAYRRDLRRVEYGDERDPAMRAFFEKIAPANNVAKITKPLFIVQGRNDPRVPYTEAEQMLAAIKKQGVPAWFMMAKDEGHGFRKQDNVTAYQQAVVLFFQQHLLP